VEGKKQGKRFRFVIMGVVWLAAFFLILDRVNISLAAPLIMEELGLSGVEMGFILSVFFWGYIIGNLGGGVASDNFNIRRFTSVILLVWCIMTALTGMCRGRYWGVFLGFAYLGMAFGLPLVGWLIQQWGWRPMFYLLGGATFFLVFIFYFMVTDHPHEHPWISQEEKDMISKSLHQDRVTFDPHATSSQKLPFREGLKILASYWPFWALCMSNFAVGGIYFANMAWLPSYLVKERGFAILESGFYLTIPYLAAFAGAVLGGVISDRLGHRSILGVLFCILIVPAMIGVMASSSIFWIIVLMCIALFCNSAALNSILVLLFDLVPAEVLGTAVGILVGIFGGLSGVAAPVIIGYFYDLTGSFFWGFSCVAMTSLAGAVFLFPLIFHERQVKQKKATKLALVHSK
jgi:ACS family D-galactonate transporter-like MFS transporter